MNPEDLRPTHVLDWDEVRTWLLDHGVPAERATAATIQVGRWASDIAAWVDVEWYKIDANGKLYEGPDGEAAKGRSSVPLHSWPTLRAVTRDETAPEGT